METEIKNHIRTALTKDKNIFHSLIDLFISYFEKPAHNMIELKARNTKMKGDIFETFCKMYLETIGYKVYFIDELPEDKREEFGLTKKDYGIDLVADKGGSWYAIQCKYRKKTRDYITKREVHRIGWKDISTFLALANRTGPDGGWKKNIVMTNADYVCWKGKKGKKDYTIAKKTFEGISRSTWCKMIGLEGSKLNEEKELLEESKTNITESKINIRDLRRGWLDRLGRLSQDSKQDS
jgi:hypothetical protein